MDENRSAGAAFALAAGENGRQAKVIRTGVRMQLLVQMRCNAKKRGENHSTGQSDCEQEFP
jgi:hypothetical protein